MNSVPMSRPRGLSILVFLSFLILGPASAAFAQPSFDKSFQPSTTGPGGVSTLSFSIVNLDSVGVRGLAFTDNLPAGMTIATPANASSSCGGVLSAPDGGSTISLAGGGVGRGSSCSITVDVVTSGVGTFNNVSGDLTSDAGNSGPASATLTVDNGRPGFSKSFAPASIAFGGRSTLTFTIDNTANSANIISFNFLDNLPDGMTVASPSSASTTCSAGGTLTANPGSSSISYSRFFTGTSALDAGASCTISVDVIGGNAGTLSNVSDELFSSTGGATVSSGKASANLEVTIERIGLTKEFTDDPVQPGENVTLEFTVTNFERSSTASSITFTDDLGATLAGLAAVDTPLANPCGSGSTLSGTSLLTLSGGNLGPESSCTFSVTLQVPSAADPGGYTNTTSALSADLGGRPASGNAASDVLFVSAAPALEKSLSPAIVGSGGTTSLDFTVTNASSTSAASDIAFTDDLSAFIGGLTISALPANGFCGTGSIAFIDQSSGNQVLTITGASLAASDSCSFSVGLSIPAAIAAGTYLNTTSEISATVDGATVSGGAASATLDVVRAPTLTKGFIDDPVSAGDTVTLQFTATYSEENTAVATDIAFTDDLGAALAGLEAIALPTDPCGVGSAITGTSNLSFTGGSLSPGESCSFDVTLQVPSSALPGTYSNTTSNVMAAVAGINVVGAPGTDDLVIAGLEFTKTFVDDPVLPGATVNLEFTLENTSTLDATGIFFTDSLSNVLSGLVVTGALPTEPCGAGSAISGTNFLVFSGGNLAAGTSCTFSVTLQVPANAADGQYPNTTSNLGATIGGGSVTLGTASDILDVASDVLLFSKEFTDDPAAPGGTVTLEFTIENLASETISDLAFTDDLDAALAGLASTGGTQSDVCGSSSSISGTGLLTFSGGSLAGGASCTFSVSLSVPSDVGLGELILNETSELTGSLGGVGVTGDPARDRLAIDFLEFTKAFDGPTFAGGTSILTFTIRNLSTSEGVRDLAFSDDLDAVLPGLVATVLPGADPCGSGSTFTGTSFLLLSNGSLLPGGSCTLVVELAVPASAEPGSYLNVTSDLRQGTNEGAGPASATLVIEELPDGPPVVAAPAVSPEPSNEGQAAIASATFSDPSGAADAPFTCTVDYGSGAGPVPGTVTGFICTGPPNVYGDNGTFDVTVTVTDKNGLFGSASAPHQVNNVAPTVAAPVVNPSPSDEGDAVTASASFSDPGSDDSPFTCTVDYGDGSGPVAGTVTGSTCDGPAHVYGDNGTFTVTVAVTDKDGGTGSASASHQVNNVVPAVATPVVDPEPSNEGSAVTASATFGDPGDDDSPFTCAVDYGDGSGPMAGTVSGSACEGPAHVYADNGTYTVTVAVTDKDGGTGSADASHQVDNVAPTITGSSNSAADCGATPEGGLVEVSADFSDPGFDNAIAGTVEDFNDSTIDWGDGTVEAADVDEVPGNSVTPTTGTVSGSHVYATGGIFTITVTVSDDDGGTDTTTLTALVTGVGLNDGKLQVVGRPGRDHVQVKTRRRGSEIEVKTNFTSTLRFPAADVEMLEVSTCDQRDVIQVRHDVTVPAILDGGGGPDKIQAGDGVTLLIGGPGNDSLFAGRNDGDILDGGPGRDFLSGNRGEDDLRGGLGDDRLFGRQADDALDGGPGVDQCVGGPGNDVEVNCEAVGGDDDDDDGGDDDDDDGGDDDDDDGGDDDDDGGDDDDD